MPIFTQWLKEQAMPGRLREIDKGEYTPPPSAPPQPPGLPVSQPTPRVSAGAVPQIPAETPKLQNGQLLPYKPTTFQRIKDALRKFNQKAGETAEFVGQAGAGSLTDIASAAFRPRGNDLQGLSPEAQQRIQKEWAPESFRRAPETAKYISPATAEIASAAGSVYPYIIAGPFAEMLGAGATTAALGKVAPKFAATAIGQALPHMAGQGTTFGGLTAIEEAIRGLSEPEKFNLAQSVKRVLSSTGEGALFGAGQEFIGAPLKNVAAKALPILSKPGVSAAAARGATGAVAGAAAMAPLAGMHYAQNRDLPSALGELAFGATMEGVPAALGGPASYAARVRTINEAKGYVPKAEPRPVTPADEALALDEARRKLDKMAVAEKPVETPVSVSEKAAEAVQSVPEAPVAPQGVEWTRRLKTGDRVFLPSENRVVIVADNASPNIMRVNDGYGNVTSVPRADFAPLDRTQGEWTKSLKPGEQVHVRGTFGTHEVIDAASKQNFVTVKSPDGKQFFISRASLRPADWAATIQPGAVVQSRSGAKLTVLDASRRGFVTVEDETGKRFIIIRSAVTEGPERAATGTPSVSPEAAQAVPEVLPVAEPSPVTAETTSPVTVSPAAKEPWQMTRQEFDAYWVSKSKAGLEAEVARNTSKLEVEKARLADALAADPENPANARVRERIQAIDQEIAAQNSRLSQPILAPSTFMSEAQLRWHQGIDQALKEGKPVPPEVLADYPDLQTSAQATAPAEAPATVPIPAATAHAPEAPTANAGIVSKFAVGDTVRIKGRPDIYTVTNTSDPSLLGLRSQYGAELKAGRSTVEPAGTDNTATQTTASATEAAATAETATAEAATGTAKSDRVQAVVLPYLQEFIEQDVVPKSKGFVQELRTVLTDLVHWLSPRTGVSDEGLTLLMKMKGERDKALFIMERTGRAVGRQFARMPQQEQVAFIDRIKKGEAQPTPELQAIADYYRKMDDATFEEIKKFRPSLPFLENHFRVLWKVIPGHAEEKGFLGLFRRPLQGSKGFLKHATLADMSEGIAKGGVPVTYNPQTMFELAQADAQRFITAQRMWAGMKEKGFARFVRMGDSIPEGYVRLNDAIAKVYFPTEEGLVGAGEYYVEANTARLLNNFLSRDLIRETALGHGLMWMKNLRTAVELSLSPFHFVFETIEAIGSQQGVGFLKLYNQGVLKSDPQAFLAGLKDIVTSPLAWKDLASTGGGVLRYVDSKEEFLKTLRGQKFIKQFPDAEQVLDDLFAGGGKLAMHEDYRLNTAKTFLENINSQNYIGATIRLVPALNEVVMTPLFEQYIPRLKIGLFFKEYGQQLAENSDALLRGEISREKLARQTWDRVENRFGEMNFDNLFWNRTLKTGLQLMFRSVTWKLGNVRGFSSALANQARNFADPLAFARDEAGRLRYKGKAPKLDPGMAWALGMMTTTATLASIIQFAYTGTWPQELKDYLYPKIGGTDDKGNDNRVSLPTYFRDVYHLWKNPVGYVKSSMSGFMTNFLEAVNNKDYYGNYIYDPEGPAYQKLLTSIAHVTGDSSYTYDPNDSLFQKVAGMVGWGVPMPFSVEQAKRLNSQGASFPQKLLSMSGFTKAPSDVIQTQFQQKLLKAYLKQRGPKKPLTPAEQKLDRMKRDLRQKVKDNALTDEDLRRAIALGLIKPKGVRAFMKDAGYNSMQIMWKYLSRDERDKLLPLANAEELDQLKVVR